MSAGAMTGPLHAVRDCITIKVARFKLLTLLVENLKLLPYVATLAPAAIRLLYGRTPCEATNRSLAAAPHCPSLFASIASGSQFGRRC